MRVVAGSAKGRRLAVPKTGTRPTSSKMRESLFSKLSSWDALEQARVLDLFAGSGALGIEALSRGAGEAVFVDVSRDAARLVKQNLATCGLRGEVTVKSALQYQPRGAFDLVFLDPPYAWSADDWLGVWRKLIPHLTPDAVVVAERAKRDGPPPLPDDLMVEDNRTFGDSTLFFISLTPQSP